MGDTETRSALLVTAGGRFCALPLDVVIEAMRPLPVEPLPGMPAFIRGLAVIRGTPTVVVDIHALLSGQAAGACGRFVTVRIDQRLLALAVDTVVGVQRLAGLDELPPLLQDSATASVEAIGARDARLLMLLRIARVVPAAVVTALDAREVRPS